MKSQEEKQKELLSLIQKKESITIHDIPEFIRKIVLRDHYTKMAKKSAIVKRKKYGVEFYRRISLLRKVCQKKRENETTAL